MEFIIRVEFNIGQSVYFGDYEYLEMKVHYRQVGTIFVGGVISKTIFTTNYISKRRLYEKTLEFINDEKSFLLEAKDMLEDKFKDKKAKIDCEDELQKIKKELRKINKKKFKINI